MEGATTDYGVIEHETVRAIESQCATAMLDSQCKYIYWAQANGVIPLSNVNGRPGKEEHSPLYMGKEITEPSDPWNVSWSQVQLGALIGRGAFGRVHLARVVLGGVTTTVALKMLDGAASAEEQAELASEIALLRAVGAHAHVVRLMGACRSPPAALLQHAPRGDLLALLRAARHALDAGSDTGSYSDGETTGPPSGRPSEADTEYTMLSGASSVCADEQSAWPPRITSSLMRTYALQIALGMDHLERNGVIHRDLAARNILVDGTGSLLVSDLGLARGGEYVGGPTRSRPVPLRWLAPEALRGVYSPASDVWAYAVVLWEIATLGSFPYSSLSNEKVAPFLAGGGRLERPPRASPRLYAIMELCWAADPVLRPSFAQLVSKLKKQVDLYVDLDSVFPSLEEEAMEMAEDEDFDEDFSFGDDSQASDSVAERRQR